jgi:hypothetical protein
VCTRAAAIFLAGALFIGCSGRREQQERAEAGRLGRAIDVLREAPNEGKRPLLRALENEPCSVAELCTLKQTCVEAYTRHLRALDGVQASRRALESREAETDSRRVAELVQTSERELGAARKIGERCAELRGEVQRRYP